MGVDVLQLPVSSLGNKYAVVFVDYQSKWPYILPARDQSAYTIAKMLVEKIIPMHGVLAQLVRSWNSVPIQVVGRSVPANRHEEAQYHSLPPTDQQVSGTFQSYLT